MQQNFGPFTAIASGVRASRPRRSDGSGAIGDEEMTPQFSTAHAHIVVSMQAIRGTVSRCPRYVVAPQPPARVALLVTNGRRAAKIALRKVIYSDDALRLIIPTMHPGSVGIICPLGLRHGAWAAYRYL